VALPELASRVAVGRKQQPVVDDGEVPGEQGSVRVPERADAPRSVPRSIAPPQAQLAGRAGPEIEDAADACAGVRRGGFSGQHRVGPAYGAVARPGLDSGAPPGGRRGRDARTKDVEEEAASGAGQVEHIGTSRRVESRDREGPGGSSVAAADLEPAAGRPPN